MYGSARPENVIDGFVRDMEGEMEHRWIAPMSGGPAWIELSWPEPRAIRHIQITFDSGFQRELTLTVSDGINQGIIRAAQPETVRDYTLLYRKTKDATPVELLKVDGNHQRLNRHHFERCVGFRSVGSVGAPTRIGTQRELP